MPLYKATLKFESCAIVWIEADDQTAATASLEAISEADLRNSTLWADLFIALASRSVVEIEEQ